MTKLLLILFAAAVSIAVGAAPLGVSVDWVSHVIQSKTTTTCQVVFNPLLLRDSPIHDNVWKALRELAADYVRFAGWFVYPRISVVAMDRPSGKNQCRNVGEGWKVNLACQNGVISSIDFASYGTPGGSCGALVKGGCHAVCLGYLLLLEAVQANSTAVLERACLHQRSCTVPATSDKFGGDPCPGKGKRLAVQARCSSGENFTYWDFSTLDELMEDYTKATQGHPRLLSLSTQPVWMFKTDAPVPYPDDRWGLDWGYLQGTEFIDQTLRELGDYYGRVYAWYTQGGFIDEYGVEHRSGLHYDIPLFEVFNEIEGEHHLGPELYTKCYDAVVQGIRRHAPQANVKYVGLALGGHWEMDYYNYFLNKSNHAPDIPLDWISYHFYALPSNRTDAKNYETAFDAAEQFWGEIKQIEAIRKRLSPTTRVTIDEVGIILPDDNDPRAPMFPRIYWNAAASMYTQLFIRIATLGIDVLGESQLVAFGSIPSLHLDPQYPSVAMTNWTTGIGNPRYWTLKMLIDHLQPSDWLIKTWPTPANPFCAGQLQTEPTVLTCGQGGTINKIDFASYGTPVGNCGTFARGACHAATSQSVVEQQCLGKTQCNITDYSAFGDPCVGTFKKLLIQARCSGQGGYGEWYAQDVFAQGFTTATGGSGRILLANKKLAPIDVGLPGSKGGVALIVDEATGDGPYRKVALGGDSVHLEPFAVALILMP